MGVSTVIYIAYIEYRGIESIIERVSVKAVLRRSVKCYSRARTSFRRTCTPIMASMGTSVRGMLTACGGR